MSGYVKCTMELNFGEKHKHLNTEVTIKVENPDLTSDELASQVLFPVVVGLGYHEKLAKEIIKIED